VDHIGTVQRFEAASSIPQQHQSLQHLLIVLLLWVPFGSNLVQAATITQLLQAYQHSTISNDTALASQSTLKNHTTPASKSTLNIHTTPASKSTINNHTTPASVSTIRQSHNSCKQIDNQQSHNCCQHTRLPNIRQAVHLCHFAHQLQHKNTLLMSSINQCCSGHCR